MKILIRKTYPANALNDSSVRLVSTSPVPTDICIPLFVEVLQPICEHGNKKTRLI